MKAMSPTLGVMLPQRDRGTQLQPKLTLLCLSAAASSPERGDLWHSLTWLNQLQVGPVLLLPWLREFTTSQAAPWGQCGGTTLSRDTFCTSGSPGMVLLQIPGGTAEPFTLHLCLKPSQGQLRSPHSHRSMLLLCHVLALLLQKAEETLMAKVLAHAPPVPQVSFSVFFRTCLTPITVWAAPVSSMLRGQQDLTQELSGTGAAGWLLMHWESCQWVLWPALALGHRAKPLAVRAACLATFISV